MCYYEPRGGFRARPGDGRAAGLKVDRNNYAVTDATRHQRRRRPQGRSAGAEFTLRLYLIRGPAV
jgi:hypothetical protein